MISFFNFQFLVGINFPKPVNVARYLSKKIDDLGYVVQRQRVWNVQEAPLDGSHLKHGLPSASQPVAAPARGGIAHAYFRVDNDVMTHRAYIHIG